ncbi:hypothetical protein HRbin08_02038 [bacterium HR08]|nr:hypothetical protein HRbin08_02038 [bacterium HR08]
MIVAPSNPNPTVNIPETAPARNASSNARGKLDRARFAVRTFPFTANHIPT